MSIDYYRIEGGRNHGDKFIGRCPICARDGRDKGRDHLVLFPDGKFSCIKGCDGKEIYALIGIKGPRPLPHQTSARKKPDLVGTIVKKYPFMLVDWWERSPVRCDEDLDEVKAFLHLFLPDDVLHVAPGLYSSGEPRHARYYQTRAEWLAESIKWPDARVCPATFLPSSYTRTEGAVMEHRYVVLESDTLEKNAFCSVLRWLVESVDMRMAAIIDSGNKSLHAWFRHPGRDLEQLDAYADQLGLDKAYQRPSQLWRLPGVERISTGRQQQLVFLDLEVTR